MQERSAASRMARPPHVASSAGFPTGSGTALRMLQRSRTCVSLRSREMMSVVCQATRSEDAKSVPEDE